MSTQFKPLTIGDPEGRLQATQFEVVELLGGVYLVVISREQPMSTVGGGMSQYVVRLVPFQVEPEEVEAPAVKPSVKKEHADAA